MVASKREQQPAQDADGRDAKENAEDDHGGVSERIALAIAPSTTTWRSAQHSKGKARAKPAGVLASPSAMSAPSWGERVNFADDGGVVAVILVRRHDRESAVAGSENDDADHHAGGEAEDEGVCFCEGHRTGSSLKAGTIPA
jgi:hypothetical protein